MMAFQNFSPSTLNQLRSHSLHPHRYDCFEEALVTRFNFQSNSEKIPSVLKFKVGVEEDCKEAAYETLSLCPHLKYSLLLPFHSFSLKNENLILREYFFPLNSERMTKLYGQFVVLILDSAVET